MTQYCRRLYASGDFLCDFFIWGFMVALTSVVACANTMHGFELPLQFYPFSKRHILPLEIIIFLEYYIIIAYNIIKAVNRYERY